MIELYRPVNCPTCTGIETALKEMVVAYKVISLAAGQTTQALPAETRLPALKDNGQIITGQAAIAAHLRELERFVADWRRFQADACYLDGDGKVC
jgi:hypothetical protein